MIKWQLQGRFFERNLRNPTPIFGVCSRVSAMRSSSGSRSLAVGPFTGATSDYAFGPATASFDLEMPGDARAACAWLEASQQPLLDVISTVKTDDRLDDEVLTNWGDRWPISRIFRCLTTEQVHHGAEISLLRDLYRNRREFIAAR